MKRRSNRVRFDGVHPSIIGDLFRIDEWCRRHMGMELIITSCTDGQHSARSRHYLGTAIDIRTWTTPTSGKQIEKPKRTELLNRLKAFLGNDWFLLDEGTHFHADYRPERVS